MGGVVGIRPHARQKTLTPGLWATGSALGSLCILQQYRTYIEALEVDEDYDRSAEVRQRADSTIHSLSLSLSIQPQPAPASASPAAWQGKERGAALPLN
jgi:hypothetical protein